MLMLLPPSKLQFPTLKTTCVKLMVSLTETAAAAKAAAAAAAAAGQPQPQQVGLSVSVAQVWPNPLVALQYFR